MVDNPTSGLLLNSSMLEGFRSGKSVKWYMNDPSTNLTLTVKLIYLLNS